MKKGFAYYNANPYRIEEEDCVCRAISLGLGLDYFATKKLLELSAEHNKCDTLCVCCYHHLLEDVFGLTVKYAEDGETVGQIAKKFPNNKCIIRISGHLTASVNGTVYDLWDCLNRVVDCYWVI